jgi:hypothetical protein
MGAVPSRSTQPLEVDLTMSLEDAMRLVLAVVASFGGGAVIVVALSKWLAGITAQRIIQNEGAALQRQLEEMKHELSLSKSSYEHYLSLILDYYAVFYRHYRLCQRTAEADAHRMPDGVITHTKDDFLENLEAFLNDWKAQEGRLRLLLPAKALTLHESAVTAFNHFKRAVEAFRGTDEAREKKRQAFSEIEGVKVEMEAALREFLRTEKLLK